MKLETFVGPFYEHFLDPIPDDHARHIREMIVTNDRCIFTTHLNEDQGTIGIVLGVAKDMRRVDGRWTVAWSPILVDGDISPRLRRIRWRLGLARLQLVTTQLKINFELYTPLQPDFSQRNLVIHES